ncbi:glucuronate isomerase [Ruficoccus amylovorans]|uniref:Uronate isomerase n=1 Tax=Ruficoccus amylovorans TaxID=1804625 RepID=A0A842HHW2_9BACT|nr:glucuronate isomerase [Ruficoccus amylovorans]MBC2595154.1 glucuronate isomerase [Ruficoccus amylovorans]
MKPFIHDDFLLQTEAARRLYHEYAKDEPIFDYHCHLPPQDVAADRRFANLFEIWLEGDHYKWRAMRANGVDESLCTGAADPYEKFLAWCKTVPNTLRNPLYHWSHLELVRYFGITETINEKTAPAIWEAANARLKEPDMSAKGILDKFKVAVVCTTDDPIDTLDHHKAIAASGIATRIYPTFRPDKAMQLGDLDAYGVWCDRLAEVSSIDTGDYAGLLAALKQRHDFFHSMGGRLSDHGLTALPSAFCSEAEAAAIFAKARAKQAVTPEEEQRLATALMFYFGHLDAEKGWTKQLHLGAMRNNNGSAVRRLGPDTGFDSIGDYPQGVALSRYLDRLAADGSLPKVVLYNLNPADNYLFATMIGNFQDGTVPGKIQFGSGWWFLDQKEAMEMQMNALGNLGLFSRFVGMLTDSRSFLSYPRHEYFRRVMCNLVGGEMERGELPDDLDLVGGMIKRICFSNAREYFGLELGIG